MHGGFCMKKVFGEDVVLWQKVGDQVVLAKKYAVELIAQEFINPKSGETDLFVYAGKKSGTTIVPITREGNLVLARQFKQGANAIVLEFPAGMLDWENPMIRAREELESETGYVSTEIISLGKTIFAPRKIQTEEHLFIARDCTRRSLQKLDSGEAAIEVYEISQKKFWARVNTGEICSAATIVAANKALQRGFLDVHAFLSSRTDHQ